MHELGSTDVVCLFKLVYAILGPGESHHEVLVLLKLKGDPFDGRNEQEVQLLTVERGEVLQDL